VVYDDTWRHRDDATPLSLSMPLAARTHPHRVVCREFGEPKVKLAMKIGRYYRLSSITRSSWQHLADDLNLDAKRLCAYVADLAGRTPKAFAAAVGDPAVVQLASVLPGRLLDHVTSRARRLAADLQP
jgi:hypothetical protein